MALSHNPSLNVTTPTCDQIVTYLANSSMLHFCHIRVFCDKAKICYGLVVVRLRQTPLPLQKLPLKETVPYHP